LHEPVLGLLAARDAFDDIALCLQIVSDQQSDVDFVLDDQNAGRRDETGVAGGFARLLVQWSAPDIIIPSSPLPGRPWVRRYPASRPAVRGHPHVKFRNAQGHDGVPRADLATGRNGEGRGTDARSRSPHMGPTSGTAACGNIGR
jgi:hypothetical protein